MEQDWLDVDPGVSTHPPTSTWLCGENTHVARRDRVHQERVQREDRETEGGGSRLCKPGTYAHVSVVRERRRGEERARVDARRMRREMEEMRGGERTRPKAAGSKRATSTGVVARVLGHHLSHLHSALQLQSQPVATIGQKRRCVQNSSANSKSSSDTDTDGREGPGRTDLLKEVQRRVRKRMKKEEKRRRKKKRKKREKKKAKEKKREKAKKGPKAEQ